MTTELVQVDTGEIVATAQRLTPAQAKQQATWLRDVMRSVLTENVDYGIIPGTGNKPTLWKPGAEMLLLAAGLGWQMTRLDDDLSAAHEGVTYKCAVKRGDIQVAECDGYAGYDEPGFTSRKGVRQNWNSVVKIAQKRALVGAALNATAGSGLFTADLDDPDPARPVFDPISLMRPHLARLDTGSRAQMTYWSQQNNMPPASQMSLEQVAAALVQIGTLAGMPPCETDAGSGSATPGEGSTGPEPSAGPSDDPEDLDDDDLGYWLAEGWTYSDGQWHAP